MIKNLTSGLAFSCLFAVAVSCNEASNNSASSDSTEVTAKEINTVDSPKNAYVDISATKSDTTGNGHAEFVQNANGSVDMDLKISFPKMANKSVAVHIHDHGDCGDAGMGAHGHWNPTNEQHGKWGSAAYHSGDIGNVQLDANGSGEIKLNGGSRWTIGGDEKTNILNHAIIVHSGVDDFTTQPTGNAGSRIGCGVITAK